MAKTKPKPAAWLNFHFHLTKKLMNTSWFELNVSVIATVAELTLCLAILGYLVSLPNKNRDAKLFAGYMLSLVLFYANYALQTLVVYPPLQRYLVAMGNILLTTVLLIVIWFAYQCRGNPYKRESYGSLVFFGSMLGLSFYLSGIDNSNGNTALVHLTGALWITGVFGRKARLAEKEEGRPTPASKMFRAFQRWALLIVLIWLMALYNPLAMRLGLPLFTLDYYIIAPLQFVQITYAAIVFLNYTPQPTSFQAKIVGLVLCPLLIILGLTPFLIRSLIVDLPNFNLVNYQISVAFLILIPLTSLAVIFGLPRFLRSNLLSPLNQILEGVRQVDAGNLSVQVPVLVNDEVGKLALQFNSMTRSLHRYSSDMETLVEERTIQLQQSLDTLKSTQTQLIQKEKMASLGELTAGIAHEIQNPLNFVNNFSEVSTELVGELKDELDRGDTAEAKAIADDLTQNLQKITHHGGRASAIVKGMLEHSRTGTGERQSTNLNALADEYLKIAYQGLRAKDKSFNAELKTDFLTDLGKVEVMPQEIGRVLLNLYNNAFYAVSQRARQNTDPDYQPMVSVQTKRLTNTVEIRVHDNGTGIPDEMKAKIFQPFFTTKPTGEGTGLGLSLSYDIVTKGHGGTLTVESVEGEGTTFVIDLPDSVVV